MRGSSWPVLADLRPILGMFGRPGRPILGTLGASVGQVWGLAGGFWRPGGKMATSWKIKKWKNTPKKTQEIYPNIGPFCAPGGSKIFISSEIEFNFIVHLGYGVHNSQVKYTVSSFMGWSKFCISWLTMRQQGMLKENGDNTAGRAHVSPELPHLSSAVVANPSIVEGCRAPNSR